MVDHEQDCALAVAHADLLVDRLRKQVPEFRVKVSAYRWLDSYVAIPCIVERAADARSAVVAELDTDFSV